MTKFIFVYENKSYELSEENCSYILNDEELPIEEKGISDIIEILRDQEEIEFSHEYYEEPCTSCLSVKQEKSKYYKFLEYHFYIFTKNHRYVISSISKDYVDTSYNKLLKKGLVDNSYIVSVIVCAECGEFSIELEQCEV